MTKILIFFLSKYYFHYNFQTVCAKNSPKREKKKWILVGYDEKSTNYLHLYNPVTKKIGVTLCHVNRYHQVNMFKKTLFLSMPKTQKQLTKILKKEQMSLLK